MSQLVEPETGGDPEGKRKLFRSSLRSLSDRLGGRASPKTVGRLLRNLGYSLRSNVKRLIGKPHPQRDWQYRLVQRLKGLYRRHGQPVVSVDAKKKELIGLFKNGKARWCEEAESVNAYDFPSDAEGKGTPYGIYDQQANHALVMVGISLVTAMFAVASIRRWWDRDGRDRYPEATHLMIEADAGGCNGHRPRLWKRELQKLADETGLTITVCHYPPGASKWNPIEHRLFSQISRNWSGYPLQCLDRMLGFIRGTTTKTGLQVDAQVDPTTYEKGIKVSDAEMRSLNLKRANKCPNYTYSIKPRKSGNN